MNKLIKIVDDELIEIASYKNPELVFHNSNNPRKLEPEYDNFESYCDYKEVINPFELYEENQQLKKQKSDVVEYCNSRRLIYKTGDEFNTKCLCNGFEILRMLGEIDE